MALAGIRPLPGSTRPGQRSAKLSGQNHSPSVAALPQGDSVLEPPYSALALSCQHDVGERLLPLFRAKGDPRVDRVKAETDPVLFGQPGKLFRGANLAT